MSNARIRSRTRLLAGIASFALLAVACGDDDGAGTTDPPATEAPADPLDAGAPDDELASGQTGPDDEAEESEAPLDDPVTDPEPPLTDPAPPLTDPAPPLTDPAPPPGTDPARTTDPPPATNDTQAPDEPPVDDEPFVLASEDQAFCTKLDELDDRPEPENDDEMAAAIKELFDELRAVVPAAILDDFETLADALDQMIANQADLDAVEDDPVFEAANNRIEEFIEVRCEGEEPSDPPVGVPDPPAEDPPLPDGFTIPVITIESEIREGTIPYFGSRNPDDGPADPEPGFQVAAADVAFCDAIGIINRRPQPVDDFEEIVVGQQYFLAILPVVPAELETEFETITQWVQILIDAGSFDAIEEPVETDPVFVAVDEVDSFVDTRCLGR